MDPFDDAESYFKDQHVSSLDCIINNIKNHFFNNECIKSATNLEELEISGLKGEVEKVKIYPEAKVLWITSNYSLDCH